MPQRCLRRFLLAICGLPLLAAAQEPVLSGEERAFLAAHPLIRVAGDRNWAPIDFVDANGRHAGIAADLLRRLGTSLGVRFQYQPTANWDEAYALVLRGGADLVSAIGRSPEREEHFAFPEPYLKFRSLIYMRSPAERVTGVAELLDRTFALIPSYTETLQLKALYPQLRTLDVADEEQKLEAVASGAADATIGNPAVIAYRLELRGLTSVVAVGTVEGPEKSVHFGVRRDWPQLVTALDAALRALPEAEQHAIRSRWYQEEQPPAWDPRQALTVALPLLAGIALVLCWVWLLRREVRMRKAAQAALRASEASLGQRLDEATAELVARNQGLAQREQQLLRISESRALDDGNLEETFRLVLRAAQAGLGVHRASIWFFDEPADAMVLQMLREGAVESSEPGVLPRREYPRYFSALDEGRALVAHFAQSDPATSEFADRYLIPKGISSMLDVGIRARGRNVGVLCCEHVGPARRWQEEESSFAAALADAVGHALAAAEKLKADQALQEMNASLEERVRQRTAQLEEARDQARAAERAKSDFLAHMSHEIRTPMNSIIGMSHLALRSGLNAQQQNYVGKIETAAKSLLGVVNDILDFSRIEAGKLSIERTGFSLQVLLDNLTVLIGQKAQDKGLELLFRVDPLLPDELVGDPLRIGQVLTNFCSNAIKFTEGGEIVVAAELVERAGQELTLCFSVKDTGIGIDAEQKSRLFSAFAQADRSTPRKYGGSGLGLTICKGLVEMMGGEIGVESQPGQGSTFWFTARLGVQLDAGAPRSVDAGELAGRRVLVVDDNASAREILATLAASLRLDVGTAASSAEALAMLQQADADRPYELVLLDWRMPVMSGAQAARRIRSGANLANLQHPPRIVMVTAYGKEDVLAELGGTPVDGLLLKPVNASTLLDALLRAFGRRGEGAAPLRDEDAVDRRLAGVRVLLAEDDEINQEIALELLRRAGMDVRVARNGVEALQLLAGHEFDLVLMDMQMPVMDGLDAARAIRRDPRWPDLPIVAMTANVLPADVERCRAVGMQGHIGKPIQVHEMFATLARVLDREGGQGAGAPHRGPAAGFDMSAGLERVGGNEPLYRRLLAKFAEGNADAAERIASALRANDLVTAQRLVHTLKGVAGNIGAAALQDAAQSLDAALKAGSSPPPAVVGRLARELDAVVRTIGGFGRVHVAAPVTVDRSALLARLGELAKKIEDNDTRAGELLGELAPLLPAEIREGPMRGLESAVAGYDFDAARQRLAAVTAAVETVRGVM